MKHLLTPLALATITTVSSSAMLQAATLGTDATAYALGNDGSTLVTLATPGKTMASSIALDFGATSPVTFEAIAYRPQTMQLYGYDNGTNAVYEINVNTGAAAQITSAPGATRSGKLGFDFNNVIDAARIVTRQDRNVVFFPNAAPPSLERKTDLFYISGDANEGANPGVVMNAYTNAVANAASTIQYVIDADQNTLATLDNNAGALSTVGALTLDGDAFNVGINGGFDILSMSEADNTAFGLLTDGATGVQGLYEVDLASGALSFFGDAPTEFGSLNGFAVLSAAAPVPVPASLPLLAIGVGTFAWLRRRNRKTA